MIRTGIGYDAHRLVAERKLVLGGVTIPFAYGLAGHSDADVLTHAITDAVLGAVAAGDIGQHFPPSDPQWLNANSIELLRQSVALVARQGWSVVNIDATVMTEAPKLAPFIVTMRQYIAAASGVAIEAVSVKATTVEGMGAIGRREGIAAMAVATLENDK
ncbi:MAG: 2-C-methyl-D-erythritol 2,4-cyclodiphosphate synthase [Lentisphaerae bacterium]|jgi:2-C-methyl-D-erythritol 2,4-cyclodiphosphate synthase|nr:2-C-methyl-D-erythritol 2,4-cyclodiphosphate synthase [Lentisphaerota bacterium]